MFILQIQNMAVSSIYRNQQYIEFRQKSWTFFIVIKLWITCAYREKLSLQEFFLLVYFPLVGFVVVITQKFSLTYASSYAK